MQQRFDDPILQRGATLPVGEGGQPVRAGGVDAPGGTEPWPDALVGGGGRGAHPGGGRHLVAARTAAAERGVDLRVLQRLRQPHRPRRRGRVDPVRAPVQLGGRAGPVGKGAFDAPLRHVRPAADQVGPDLDAHPTTVADNCRLANRCRIVAG
ncbi:hypothetical protein Athai_28470 [Actinocatenispora thailandica]|uniref:Uncharacterized protein n=1 Tax=Actinocatenispora thailandica TaxID=227318 RepID=A0A7R7HXQ2_9ACTN|nr:hypothetical protein Athai_28470 [Actinocatenispora thailandica]